MLEEDHLGFKFHRRHFLIYLGRDLKVHWFLLGLLCKMELTILISLHFYFDYMQ